MAIGSLGVSSNGEHIYMEYVCSWRCATVDFKKRRIKPMYEEGYELAHPTMCNVCDRVIEATESYAND